jgi:hypothetical protein
MAAGIAVAISRASAAYASGTGVIATSVDGNRAPVAEAMAAAIGGGGAARVVADAVSEARAAVAAGAVPVELLAHVRGVREAIDEGWRAYLQVSVEFAASRLAAARQDAEALVALPGGAELYADASLRLGAVLLHQGRADEGRAAIALALALDPARPVTLADFAPDVVDAADAVRAAAPAVAQHVRVVTEPAGAHVEVDGVDRGVGPAELELARGQHVIAAHAVGYVARALGAGVDANTGSLRVELEKDDDDARLALGATPGLDRENVQLLVDTVTRFADLDGVVLASVVDRRGEPALRVQRCVGIPARCTAVVEVGYGEPSGLAAAARQAWAAAKTAEATEAPNGFGGVDAAETAAVMRQRRCGACRSPLVWGGAVVAVTVGIIAVWAANAGNHPPPVVGVTGGDFGGATR